MSILTVENVTHGFGARQILNNASFRLLKGEHIGLVGANGEGKSTFVRWLAMEDKYFREVTEIDGQRGIEAIPKSLQEVCLLRLKHPEASIKELGEYANPPLSKSAVYHRIRRINEMLEE